MSIDKYAQIFFESQFTDPVNVNVDFDPEAPGSAKAILSVVKPKISVITAVGEEKIAPYGDPDPVFREVYKAIGATLLSLLIFYLIAKFIR